ncbi:MAG: DUF4386 domain-containing protein [Chloroflexi bacterium]|nr:DUF4386 domain-containing protein [Chloroflexota bacterium]
MNNKWLYLFTGLLLVIVPAGFLICFTLLQSQFEYPDILRQSTPEILRKFQAGGSGLIAIWYALTLAAFLFIPVSVLMHQVLESTPNSRLLTIATVFGVVAGLVQTLGFIRWPFLVPHLAAAYLAPAASEAQRQAAALIFEAFHLYAGAALGEHLGYLCTGLWTFLVALVIVRSSLFKPWMGWIGTVLAIGVGVGLLELAGWESAGAINAISYLLWALWLIGVGVVLLLKSIQKRD